MSVDATMDSLMYPKLVNKPSIERIEQDFLECLEKLKQGFMETGDPVTDDSQCLQKICAKLEYLLTYEMKEHTSLLGRKKSYWDYFCECLTPSKGLRDGLKYVKSLKEYRTAVGKGRALIRFALVHKRLADTIQQCVSNGRITSDWYYPSSPWLQHKHSSVIINALYDINDVNFDLIPTGYDLDNSWPSFARKTNVSYSWNPPSRTSSMSSLLSIPSIQQDSPCSKPDVASSFAESIDEEEYMSPRDTSSNVSCSELYSKIEELEEEKFTTSQEVALWVKQLADLKEKYRILRQDYDSLSLEYSSSQQAWQDEKDRLDLERRKLTEGLKTLQVKLTQIEHEHEQIVSTNRSRIETLEKEKATLEQQINCLKSTEIEFAESTAIQEEQFQSFSSSQDNEHVADNVIEEHNVDVDDENVDVDDENDDVDNDASSHHDNNDADDHVNVDVNDDDDVNVDVKVDDDNNDDDDDDDVEDRRGGGGADDSLEYLKQEYESELEKILWENRRLQRKCEDFEEVQRQLHRQNEELVMLQQCVEEKAELLTKYQEQRQHLKSALNTLVDCGVMEDQDHISNFESSDEELNDTVQRLFEFVKEAKSSNLEDSAFQQTPDEGIREEISLLKSELETSRTQVAHLQSQGSGFSEKIDRVTSENRHLKECLERLESDLEAKTKLCSALEEEGEASKVHINNFGCERQNMLLLNEQMKEKLSIFEKNNEELKTKNFSIQSELDGCRECYETQISSINEKHEETKQQLVASKEKFQEKLNQVLEENQNLTQEMADVKKQAADLHVKVVKAEAEKIDLRQELDQVMLEHGKSNDMKVTLQSVIDSLQVDKDRLMEEKRVLRLSEQDFKDVLQEKDEAISRLKKESEKSQELVSSEMNLVKEELSAAHFQLSAQQLQHQKSVEAMESQERELQESQKTVKEKEDALKGLQEEKERLESSMKTQMTCLHEMLEKTQADLKNSEEEYSRLQEKCEMTNRLNEERIQAKHIQNVNLIKQKDQEILILQMDLKDLKRRVIKLTREKDHLWKQTDKLAYHRRLEASKKWMDNSEVSNCLGCNAVFSFTLRKHHCRMCGKIYCYNCTSRQIMTAHSSKKIRACEKCYESHKEQREDSANPILCVDSEEEDRELSETSSYRRSTKWSESASDVSDMLDHTDDMDSFQDQNSEVGPSSLSVASGDITKNGSSDNSMDDKHLASSDDAGNNAAPSSGGATTTTTTTTDSQNQNHDGDNGNDADVGASEKCSGDDNGAAGDGGKSGGKVVDADSSNTWENSSDFAVISEEEIAKMRSKSAESDDNLKMPTGITVSLEELERGEINSERIIWIRFGCSYTVSVCVNKLGLDICWEFTSSPKDIAFGVTFTSQTVRPREEGDKVLVPVQKCQSHQQTIKGQLTPRDLGIYQIVFDNSYSRLTSKKITYSLHVRKIGDTAYC
ncbi:FYVE and coiled-coil domain-containing protein 1-like [Argonauta hians]